MYRTRVLVALLLAFVVMLAACATAAPTPAAYSQEKAAASTALGWLRAQLQDDGSFNVGFGHPAGVTCDAILAIAAADKDPAQWRAASSSPSMTDYLAATASEYAVDAATTGKLITTLVAAGQKPRDFAGVDWIARLNALAADGQTYDPGSVGQAWAILALKAAGEKIPSGAVSVLKGYQLETGAWASTFGVDNDTVSYVLQALVAGGEPANSQTVQKALAFLEGQQNDDGGFPAIKPSEWGTDSNANSTAAVIMALNALGQNPGSARWTRASGNPMQSLLALRSADGRIEFQPGVGDPLLSTVQAIPALYGASLPMLPKS